MRFALLAASALILAACNGETPPPAPAVGEKAAATPAPSPAETAHAGMDHAMAAADAADDGAKAETPNGHTFHTAPGKVEEVHLPSAGAGTWTVTVADTAFVTAAPGADETMPDGTKHHVVKLTPVASTAGVAVKFERRETADPAAPVVETRTVSVMVH